MYLRRVLLERKGEKTQIWDHYNQPPPLCQIFGEFGMAFLERGRLKFNAAEQVNRILLTFLNYY